MTDTDPRDQVPTHEFSDRAGTSPTTTAADRLQRDAETLRSRMGEHPARDGEELESLARERGWLEAVAHLARAGGLTHAGMVEAGKMVAASEEWFAGVTDTDRGPER